MVTSEEHSLRTEPDGVLRIEAENFVLQGPEGVLCGLYVDDPRTGECLSRQVVRAQRVASP